MTGIDVKVPVVVLARSPTPARLPPDVLENCTIPCWLVVTANCDGNTNDVCPLAPSGTEYVPSWLPLVSSTVAVMVADEDAMLATATAVRNPPVSSNGTSNFDSNWVCNGVVPSD